jgi:opacity protein-like surface antigen
MITRTVAPLRRLLVILVVLTAGATPTAAAPGQGAIIAGTISGAAIDGGTDISLAGSIGYRVNRALGFGVELTSIPTFEPRLPIPQPDPLGLFQTTYSNSSGRATVFTTNVRVELPTASGRVIPYVIGGGGVASVVHRATISVTYIGAPPTIISPISGVPITALALSLPPTTASTSSAAMALTLGGGVSLLVAPHFSVDPDIRYLRLMQTNGANVWRFGVGASYRF